MEEEERYRERFGRQANFKELVKKELELSEKLSRVQLLQSQLDDLISDNLLLKQKIETERVDFVDQQSFLRNQVQLERGKHREANFAYSNELHALGLRLTETHEREYKE